MDTNSETKIGCLHVVGVILLTVSISVSVTLWVIQYFLFPKPFQPVTLDARETTVLEQKLQQIGLPLPTDDLTPEPYTEVGASREISLTEKDLNALLAKNTDMAESFWQSLAAGVEDIHIKEGHLLIKLKE